MITPDEARDIVANKRTYLRSQNKAFIQEALDKISHHIIRAAGDGDYKLEVDVNDIWHTTVTDDFEKQVIIDEIIIKLPKGYDIYFPAIKDKKHIFVISWTQKEKYKEETNENA